MAQCLERPTDILEGHGFDFCWGTQNFIFLSNQVRLEKASTFILLYSRTISLIRDTGKDLKKDN